MPLSQSLSLSLHVKPEIKSDVRRRRENAKHWDPRWRDDGANLEADDAVSDRKQGKTSGTGKGCHNNTKIAPIKSGRVAWQCPTCFKSFEWSVKCAAAAARTHSKMHEIGRKKKKENKRKVYARTNNKRKRTDVIMEDAPIPSYHHGRIRMDGFTDVDIAAADSLLVMMQLPIKKKKKAKKNDTVHYPKQQASVTFEPAAVTPADHNRGAADRGSWTTMTPDNSGGDRLSLRCTPARACASAVGGIRKSTSSSLVVDPNGCYYITPTSRKVDHDEVAFSTPQARSQFADSAIVPPWATTTAQQASSDIMSLDKDIYGTNMESQSAACSMLRSSKSDNENIMVPPPPSSSAGKRKFPQTVHDMVKYATENFPEMICWTAEGDAFVVKDRESAIGPILSQYFRTSKYSSLYKQLGNYGWRMEYPPGE
mmetsp:Transcript_37545/g.90574  ORF Transcript_37545/g.90574 Transcript_37545/m.90574 type:complete len:425 (+) Transcript_37545:71-1345(+)